MKSKHVTARYNGRVNLKKPGLSLVVKSGLKAGPKAKIKETGT